MAGYLFRNAYPSRAPGIRDYWLIILVFLAVYYVLCLRPVYPMLPVSLDCPFLINFPRVPQTFID